MKRKQIQLDPRQEAKGEAGEAGRGQILQGLKRPCQNFHSILLSHKKKEGNLTFCDSMDGPREFMLSEISRLDK